jgi:twitching motility protein PilT
MDLQGLLRLAREKGASDLHLIVSCPPLLRIDGTLQGVGDITLSPEDVAGAFEQITTATQRESYSRQMELDFSYVAPTIGRLRCNACRQQSNTSLAIRLLPPTVPTVDDLGLPPIYKNLASAVRGLVVVSGPAGSGKSTSLAAMVNHINHTQQRYIVTVEDPIEYVHSSIRSAISQREIGADTHSFSNALRHVLRQDPDVIVLGEMRDVETAHSVLTLAETGHLVISTGHAPSCAGCVERIVDLFPSHERSQASARLASVLVAITAQALVPRLKGGRVAATEIMLGEPAVKNLIREGKTYLLPNLIRTSNQLGMKTLDQSLVELYVKDIISWETVVIFCHEPAEAQKLVGETGVR